MDLADENLPSFPPITGVLARFESGPLRLEAESFLDSDTGTDLGDILEGFLRIPSRFLSEVWIPGIGGLENIVVSRDASDLSLTSEWTRRGLAAPKSTLLVFPYDSRYPSSVTLWLRRATGTGTARSLLREQTGIFRLCSPLVKDQGISVLRPTRQGSWQDHLV